MNPFHKAVYSSFINDEGVETISATQEAVYVNSKWFESLTEQQQALVIEHEVRLLGW